MGYTAVAPTAMRKYLKHYFCNIIVGLYIIMVIFYNIYLNTKKIQAGKVSGILEVRKDNTENPENSLKENGFITYYIKQCAQNKDN